MTCLFTKNTKQAIIVDSEDYERLSEYAWYAGLNVRFGVWVYTNIRNKKTSISQIIMGALGVKFDHKDRNPFNNQKDNLRTCTVSQNTVNTGKLDFALREPTSIYKGVYRSKAPRAQNNPWMARIMCNGVSKHLGCFNTEKKAAIAYNATAKKIFGEFAYINQINENTKEN